MAPYLPKPAGIGAQLGSNAINVGALPQRPPAPMMGGYMGSGGGGVATPPDHDRTQAQPATPPRQRPMRGSQISMAGPKPQSGGEMGGGGGMRYRDNASVGGGQPRGF